MIQASDWNLVAAGESRRRLKPEHLLPDSPVVTVNRAIDILDLGLPVNFAAFADGPGGVWGPLGLEKYALANPTLQLWVSLRHVTQKREMTPGDPLTAVDVPGPPLLALWDRTLPASVGVRVLPHGNVEDSRRPGIWRHAFTTLCALERIWMFRPKKVRILCADMAGSWIPGLSEEECHGVEKRKFIDGKSMSVLDRWHHEKLALERSIKSAKKVFDVEVEWTVPE